jgi:starch phosphorylase
MMVIVSVTPEIGLEELYTYAGGLGVLEGDKFLAAALKNVEYVVLTLFYRGGYVNYIVEDNDVKPVEQQHPRSLREILRAEEEFNISLKGENVTIRPLVYSKGSARIVFFEAISPSWASRLTERVYIEGSDEEKYYKYILLAKASAKYIEDRIGVENVEALDLQEAYSTLTILALKDKMKPRLIRFITHTPGPWGHPSFPTSIIRDEFSVDLPGEKIVLTIIGFEKAESVFAVSRKHRDIMRKVFPKYAEKMNYITNGVCVERWLSEPAKRILKGKRAEDLTVEDARSIRSSNRQMLLELVGRYKLEAEDWAKKPILVWARRITRYKRPYFVTWLFERDPSLADKFFIVLSGKPHPADKEGIEFLKQFINLSRREANVAYIPGYDINKAKVLLAGGDYLLFTPFSGWEACGTSYMKAMINGVPPISSRDGGALELIEHGVNGLLFGKDNREFISLQSEEAKKIDEEDFKGFRYTLRSALELWGTENYWMMSLNAIRTGLAKATILRVMRQYYPWRKEFSSSIFE